jgi:hypothetical protein
MMTIEIARRGTGSQPHVRFSAMNQPAWAASMPTLSLRRAFGWWLAQVRHMLPPTIFFFVGFNLILWTKHLILREHDIDFSGFVVATLAALLVGKAVLITDNLSLMHRFDGRPLIQPILFKTAIYWACILVVRLAEELIYFFAGGGSLGDYPSFLVARFSWPRFLSIQIWLMVLFLLYVTIHEVNTLFGDGELYRLLNRLTEANWAEAISERGSPPNTKVVAILHELSSPNRALLTPTELSS